MEESAVANQTGQPEVNEAEHSDKSSFEDANETSTVAGEENDTQK